VQAERGAIVVGAGYAEPISLDDGLSGSRWLAKPQA